jgi:hypothetical protein
MQTRTWHSGMNAVGPLVSSYDIPGRKGEVLFHSFAHYERCLYLIFERYPLPTTGGQAALLFFY